MKPYPHHYTASASARATDVVTVSAPSLPSIETAAPPEFDGPGGLWTPEALLCAAVADCFILTFRALARAAHFDWLSLDCEVVGVLEHIGNISQFTRFETRARLNVAAGADHGKAHVLLGRAEDSCLIANSLRGERTLSTEVLDGEAKGAAAHHPEVSSGEAIERPAPAKAPQPETRQPS